MKAIAFFLFSGVLLVSSVSAFANSRSDPMASSNSKGSTVPAIASSMEQSIQQWVGKPATQVVKALGEPNYRIAAKHGRLIYDYVRPSEHVGPIATYQFLVGQNGKVTAATLTL